jgi:hypothetical protein
MGRATLILLLLSPLTLFFLLKPQRASSLAFTRPPQIYSIASQSAESSLHSSKAQKSNERSSACDSSVLHASSSSKWDTIIIDDEDDDEFLIPPKDMEYTPKNIMRQHENYLAISKVGGNETITDIYARDPTKSTFWFVGKVCRCTGTVSTEQAIQRQWYLIQGHAARLRHKELASSMKTMELWAAPGDSELDVAFNRPHIQFTNIPRPKRQSDIDRLQKSVKAVEIGFQGEIYDQGEEGFRTERTNEGLPANPERKGFQ